ncbi:MAG: tetratricopeptide repeat protein [Deltaproteobacteria bacterium]|nr:tetratricopeptide repeat protein [Deltaproteobacteria bacterium]
MTVIELHPEELLERATEEPLSAADQAHLETHLSSCVSCRLLQQAREDFLAEREEDHGLAAAAVQLAPEVFQELSKQTQATRKPPVEPADRGVERGQRRWIGARGGPRSGPRSRVALLAAAAVLIGTAAAASGWVGNLWRATTGEDGTAAPLAPVLSQTARPALGDVPRDLGAPPMPTEAEAEPEVETVAEPPVPAEPSSPPEQPAAPPRPAVDKTAATLFDRAAEARTAGRYEAALEIYRDLQRRFPDSHEAQASHAIVARLLLDTGRAEDALADYDEYLADGGAPLTEEAMVGRGRAYQRLGRNEAEQAAWRALLLRFPESVHAHHARARLEALGSSGQE